MKIEIIPSPSREEVLLKIGPSPLNGTVKLILTRPELHELDWAICKFSEEEPIRTAKEATGK